MREALLLRKTILFILLLVVGGACTFPARLVGVYRPTDTAALPKEPAVPTATRATTFRTIPAPTTPPSGEEQSPNRATLPAGSPYSCTYYPAVAAALGDTSADQWMNRIRQLSGSEAVQVGGKQTRIKTRYSQAMFSGQENAQAFEWVKQQVLQWYAEDQVQEQPFTVESDDQSFTWKNLVITLPGAVRPDEIVVLAAHLDSTSEDPMRLAPGAEDNGSGSAALLEAARLFSSLSFERTIQIVWFTGEEQGLLGSQAFTAAVDSGQVVGAVNLDMFGFDSDQDRCFELHVGQLSASEEIGACFTQTIEAYNLDLTYDYLTTTATSRSDHGSFWENGIGAVEVLEDLFNNDMQNGCRASDPNPYYHTTEDVADHINAETGFSIVRAALATVAAMAVPLEEQR